ncbi:MAG: hypothetical protein IPP74_10385 [Alphaproteobacteria bacterium]|nr:hypothetical protein [Alphaproteobacteria bacterium]
MKRNDILSWVSNSIAGLGRRHLGDLGISIIDEKGIEFSMGNPFLNENKPSEQFSMIFTTNLEYCCSVFVIENRLKNVTAAAHFNGDNYDDLELVTMFLQEKNVKTDDITVYLINNNQSLEGQLSINRTLAFNRIYEHFSTKNYSINDSYARYGTTVGYCQQKKQFHQDNFTLISYLGDWLKKDTPSKDKDASAKELYNQSNATSAGHTHWSHLEKAVSKSSVELIKRSAQRYNEHSEQTADWRNRSIQYTKSTITKF